MIPTEPGWYWWRLSPRYDWRPREVWADGDELMVGDHHPVRLGRGVLGVGEWGPRIEPPGEAVVLHIPERVEVGTAREIVLSITEDMRRQLAGRTVPSGPPRTETVYDDERQVFVVTMTWEE